MINKIICASDYRGIALKEKIVKSAGDIGTTIQDIGIVQGSTIDYIDISKQLSEEILRQPGCLGVIICGSGQGVAIVLNRFSHIRACVCRTPEDATNVREKLDANVLCLGSKQNTFEESLDIIRAFIKTPFMGGKHTGCVQKLKSAITQHHEKGMNLIVRALIIQDGHLLFTKATEDTLTFSSHNYFLPGGHVNHGEPCLAALQRELFEEMSIAIDSVEFVGALECCWDRHGSGYHEINIVYLVKIQGLDVNSPPKSVESYQKFVWVPFEHLATLPVLPEILRNFIGNIIDEPRKIEFYSEMKWKRAEFTE